MKIAVVSDLHLAPDGVNRCTATPSELLHLFEAIQASADRVVLAGDLFDLDRPRMLGGWRAQLAQLYREQPELLERMEAFEWLVGNHDAALCRRAVPQERCVLADGLRVLIRHGHQWDMLLKKMPALAPSANFVAGWLQRADLQGAASALGRAPLVFDRMLNRNKKGGRDRLLEGAQALLVEEGWDVVVCGHSHDLRLVAGEHGLFVNTGSVCEGTIDWALIDTDAAAPSVTLMRDGQLHERAEKLAGRWQLLSAT